MGSTEWWILWAGMGRKSGPSARICSLGDPSSAQVPWAFSTIPSQGNHATKSGSFVALRSALDPSETSLAVYPVNGPRQATKRPVD